MNAQDIEQAAGELARFEETMAARRAKGIPENPDDLWYQLSLKIRLHTIEDAVALQMREAADADTRRRLEREEAQRNEYILRRTGQDGR